MAKCKKVCAYKGCDPNDNHNETFFSFPSDPDRCQIWRDLSKTELVVPKYLCSKHFDRQRYISENPRRNILLNTAIPFPYETTDNDKTYSDHSAENVLQLVENVITAIEIVDDQSENVMKDEFIEIINNRSIVLDERNEVESITKSNEPCKRKSNMIMTTTIPSKLSKIQNETIEPNVSKNNIDKSKLRKSVSIPNNSDDNTSNDDTDSQITTFIFKGEEYIQMPKSLYLKEKSILEKKVEHYENIVFGIQSFLEKESEFKL